MNLDNLLVLLSSFNGDWDAFNEKIYEYFCDDFIDDPPIYQHKEVGFREIKKDNGKEETFWHITSNVQKTPRQKIGQLCRTPDIKRSERIRWIKQIIENSTDPSIKKWVEIIEGQPRHHIWYRDEFLVVLGEYPKYPYFRLITAFCTHKTRIPYFQKKFETYRNKKAMPS